MADDHSPGPTLRLGRHLATPPPPPPALQADAIAALAAEAQAALGAFWAAERLSALCQALIGGHFRLTAR